MVDDAVLTAGANISLTHDEVADTLTIAASGGIGPEGPEGPQGPPGPNAVSTDANNVAVLGTDSLIFVPQNAAGGMSQGEWMFSTTTSAPPSSGQIRLNNGSHGLATAMYIHNVTAPGIDAGNMLRFSILAGCKLVLQEKNSSANYIEYSVTAAPTVQSGYLEVPIAVVVAGGAVPAQRCLLIVISPPGVTLPVAIADGGTGATNAATARTNLGAVNKAGDTMTGNLAINRTNAGVVLNKLTGAGGDYCGVVGQTNGSFRWILQVGNSTAEAGSNTGSDFELASLSDADAYLDSPLVIARSTGIARFSKPPTSPMLAFAALTDAATVAVDWSASVNFSLTVTANRQIGNPTNAEAGTYRTILVQGNDATARTITFASNYLGSVPVIADCTSTKWYLLTLMCITTSHFVVTSVQAK